MARQHPPARAPDRRIVATVEPGSIIDTAPTSAPAPQETSNAVHNDDSVSATSTSNARSRPSKTPRPARRPPLRRQSRRRPPPPRPQPQRPGDEDAAVGDSVRLKDEAGKYRDKLVGAGDRLHAQRILCRLLEK